MHRVHSAVIPRNRLLKPSNSFNYIAHILCSISFLQIIMIIMKRKGRRAVSIKPWKLSVPARVSSEAEILQANKYFRGNHK